MRYLNDAERLLDPVVAAVVTESKHGSAVALAFWLAIFVSISQTQPSLNFRICIHQIQQMLTEELTELVATSPQSKIYGRRERPTQTGQMRKSRQIFSLPWLMRSWMQEDQEYKKTAVI